MIITEEVEIKMSGLNIKHFKNLGYSIKYGDIIKIPVEHLSEGSGLKIKVKCDICGKEKVITYQTYLKNISKHNIYACSVKCAQIKTRKTNLKNHGVEWLLQLPEIREKGKITKLEKYDDENYNNRDKMKQTKLKNHGDENYNNKEQTKQTNLKKYGVIAPLQSPEIRKKSRQTKLKNHGDEYFTNQEKTRKTNLKNLGVEMPFQSQEIQDKCNQTLFKNHGVENAFQIPGIYNKIYETIHGISYEQYLEQLPDFIRYRNEVLKFTRKQPLYLLENYNKRGPSGKENSYHLDHKFSISEGFKNNICPYIIGNIINLEMLSWENNLSKNYKCSITKEKLFEKYDNNNIYILKNDIF